MDPFLAVVVDDDHRRTQQQEQHPRIVSQNAAMQIAVSQHSVRVHPTQNAQLAITAEHRRCLSVKSEQNVDVVIHRETELFWV